MVRRCLVMPFCIMIPDGIEHSAVVAAFDALGRVGIYELELHLEHLDHIIAMVLF